MLTLWILVLLQKPYLSLYGFGNVDLVGCPTIRSTISFCVFIEANCILWYSKKEPIVVCSNSKDTL